MHRTILHSDLNNFFASVECLFNPEIRDKPVAVCGDPEARHGIVLAKNYHAKRFGIITGEAIWQAKQKCPSLVVVKPDYPRYLEFALAAREIYGQYTDQIEPFGMDEAWLDVTGSTLIKGEGEHIADEIRQRIHSELGITCSLGVADNKIFAKLGSDMKKPDATTIITKENFKDTVWQLPARDLLYVGRATDRKLSYFNIRTIGDIARCDSGLLRMKLGKWGDMLWMYANGLDCSPVSKLGYEAVIKSIGNSTTAPRDLVNDEDIKITVIILAESVAERLREHGLKCRTVQIYVRDNKLESFERQARLTRATHLSLDITAMALNLFNAAYDWHLPVRSIGVRAADLISADEAVQLNLFNDTIKKEKLLELERNIDTLRSRYGHFCVQKAVMLTDSRLTRLNPKDDHAIQPFGS